MIVPEKPGLDELAHHGVKGMKWGVRKDDPSGASVARAVLPGPTIDPALHATTKAAARNVSGLMNDRYGFQINQIKELGKDSPYYPDTAAYVMLDSKGTAPKGVMNIQAGNLNPRLKQAEEGGWFGKDCGTTTALMTHESAHSLFHANQKVVRGAFSVKVVGGEHEARNKAWNAAFKAAKQDGIGPYELTGHVSGYAKAANVREEVEAEMFTQYHWQKNPPRFVKVWGETLHKEMGLDPTPFREGVKHV